jgi:hypothetical protein
MEKSISIIEKYLNENFWIDHYHQNGYPTKVMAKADFMSMLNELKLEYANQSREEGSGKLPLSELKNLLVEINQLIARWNATEAQWSEWDKEVQAKIYQLQLKIDEKSEVKFG